MRSFAVIALVLGCGGPTASPQASVPVTAPSPPSPPIEAELVTELTPPAIGRAAMIDYFDQWALTIDEAGVARQTLRPQLADQHWIPFSEPVDAAVFVKQFAYPHNVPGAQLGRMFCGRTRTARLECVIDFDATPKAPRRVHRFKLPVAGAVQHLGVYTPWMPQGGPDKAICVTATAATCWSFDWVGMRAERYTLDATAAETAALRIAPEIRLAWQQATPSVTAANIREVVQTDRQDVGRVIGKEANISVHCARLVNGELWCYGPGVYGELGDGTLALTPRASRPLGDTQVVDVATGRHHVCVVVADGRIACWGDLSGNMPLPKRHTRTPLPMCPLDRSASTSKFAADRAAAIQRAADCAKGCGDRGRDGCLGCDVRCIPMPYVFRHDAVCQEPAIDGALLQRGEACLPEHQEPRWLTDAELHNYAPEEKLTLSPVFLTGITDAVGVTETGPRLCVIRRSGAIACLDDNGKLP